MAKIDITTAKNVIESNPRKAYFKIKNTGGPKGATGAQGPQGIPGSNGAQGVPGKAATITIGSTTTLAPGSSATVTNSGDQYDAVLEFGIPTGAQGPTGATGAQGPRGFQGEKGAKGDTGAAATLTLGYVDTGEPGTNASITNTGDEHNAVYNFTIPRGAKGDKGDSATVSVYGTQTLPAGSQATVANVGTSQNVQLQFGIPQGEPGHDAPEYTAGTGLTLNDTEFSVDTTVIAEKSDLDDYYTKTETDTKLAPKIEAEVVESLPATGDEGKLYLTPKDYTTGTATGNPITITLSEEAGQITSAQLDGDTFQQSYTGVNLCDSQNMYISSGTGVTLTHESDGSITINGYNTGDYLNIRVNATALFQTHVGENVTVSVIEVSGEGKWSNFGIKTPASSLGVTLYKSSGRSSYTGALQESSRGEYWCDLYCDVADARNFVNYRVKLQAELSSTATSYEPYVGGVPSPNPDYPQQIQTVTGVQTVSINGTDYPISLGSIELCKLGDYQDYIYKSGSDWKVHKATASYTFQGTEVTDIYASNAVRCSGVLRNAIPHLGNSKVAYCNHFTLNQVESSVSGTIAYGEFALQAYSNVFFRINSTITTKDLANAWLASNQTTIKYQLATATDTTITDTSLIAQLEAVRNATLQASNTITNTATGTNLAGDLELGYEEYDPTNRYDKWLWLDLNNNYEKLGS